MEELPLRDIHLPDPVSWWPLAIGYWMVGFLILIACTLLIFLIRFLFRSNVKKEAKTVLHSIESHFKEQGDAALCVKELSALLRRVVISQKESEDPAGLTGDRWLNYLDQRMKKPEFSKGVGRVLLSGPYQPRVDKESVERLLQLCHKWMGAL